MAASIKHHLFFPHPPVAVWEYLTNAELMDLWLMKSDFQPVLGHEFTFKSNPVPVFEWDGIIYCKVTEIVPFTNLSYTWNLGPGDGANNLESVVKWELRPTDKGTELILEHGDFALLKHISIFDAMNAGWLQNMNKILNRLNETSHGATNV